MNDPDIDADVAGLHRYIGATSLPESTREALSMIVDRFAELIDERDAARRAFCDLNDEHRDTLNVAEWQGEQLRTIAEIVSGGPPPEGETHDLSDVAGQVRAMHRAAVELSDDLRATGERFRRERDEQAQVFRSCMRSVAAALDIDPTRLDEVDPLAAIDDVIVPAIQGNTAKLDELSLRLAEAVADRDRARRELDTVQAADRARRLRSSIAAGAAIVADLRPPTAGQLADRARSVRAAADDMRYERGDHLAEHVADLAGVVVNLLEQFDQPTGVIVEEGAP